jgi:hypothetical protein
VSPGSLPLVTVAVSHLLQLLKHLSIVADCRTRYHPNYYVHSDATLRTYYRDNLRYLQISGHFYVDIDLCELFSIMMVTSWCALHVLCVLLSSFIARSGLQQRIVLVPTTRGC